MTEYNLPLVAFGCTLTNFTEYFFGLLSCSLVSHLYSILTSSVIVELMSVGLPSLKQGPMGYCLQ